MCADCVKEDQMFPENDRQPGCDPAPPAWGITSRERTPPPTRHETFQDLSCVFEVPTQDFQKDLRKPLSCTQCTEILH